MCRKWNQLLINTKKFNKDYHLYLTDLLTLDVVHLLQQSECSFSALTMNQRATRAIPYEEIKDFWDHLGTTVTEMNIHQVRDSFDDDETYKVIGSFQLLKTLYAANYTGQTSKLPVLPNLECFKAYSLQSVQCVVPKLLEKFPKLTTVDYEYGSGLGSMMTKYFNNYPRYWRTMFYNEEYETDYTFREPFFQMKDCKVDRLFYTIRSNNRGYEFLSKILESHPQIREVHVDANFNYFPPVDTHHRITHFKTSIRENFNFTNFASFSALHTFHVMISSGVHCPIGHESVSVPTVKHLHFYSTSTYCAQCYHTLIDAFPNLEELHITCDTLVIEEIERLLHHWPKLKHASFTPITSHVSDIMSLPVPVIPPVSLKYLEIDKGIHEFGYLLECFPKLETLKYLIDATLRFDELEKFFRFVPELKTLHTRKTCHLADINVDNDVVIQAIINVAMLCPKIKVCTKFLQHCTLSV